MILDHTEITIRERNFMEVLDLGLHVITSHWKPLLIAFLIGVVPFALLNYLLLRNTVDANEIWDTSSLYCFWLVILMALEVPLATAPMILYLGQATFSREVRWQQITQAYFGSLPQMLWFQGVVRFLCFALFVIGLAIPYLSWPYLSEVILLERNPMFTRKQGRASTWKRSRNLHRNGSGDLFSRWIASVGAGSLLIASMTWGMSILSNSLLGTTPDRMFFLLVGIPFAAWLIVGFFAVVRFPVLLGSADPARRLGSGAHHARRRRSTSRGAGMSDLENPQFAVEAGKNALRDRWDYNWYDRASDDVSRINVRPSNPDAWQMDDWFDGSWSGGWFSNWNWSEMFAVLGWITIGILLAIVAYLLIRAYLDSERGRRVGTAATEAAVESASLDRVEALPVGLRNPTGDFLEEARRHYQAGNLAEAIIYLFSYQLIQLDRHHMLRLTKGKTNRQYLREVHRAEPQVVSGNLAHLLRQTMMLFEASFFGGKELSRNQFDTCWGELERFQSLLAAAEPVPVSTEEPAVQVTTSAPLSLLAVGLLLLSGCGPELSTEYGRRTGTGAGSVNGTTVLGEMFSDAGHDVGSWDGAFSCLTRSGYHRLGT